MTRRKTNTPIHRDKPAGSSPRTGVVKAQTQSARLRQFLLAVLVAVYVATPLLPGEAAADFGTGLPLVMLLWILTLIWLAQGVVRGQLEARFEPVGTALIVLVGWLAISVVIMAPLGAPRPAINSLWEWMAYVIGFRMIIQLVRSACEIRAICAVMISLAVALSIFGAYQFAVSLPQQRAAYFEATAEQRAEIRHAAGVYASEGSPAVEHFDQRLASVEPWATFGLANSLAAFLVPWIVVAAGVLIQVVNSANDSKRTIAAMSISLLLMGTCLLLTKSRAGWLAVFLGGLLLGSFCHGRLSVVVGRGLLVTILVVALLIVAAVGVGGLDTEVFSEAPKSLQYRFEYWQATGRLIADHPWFGCGLGNFQQYYLQYKLPQASEEIKDPHNFLLEVWATGGSPASLALLLVLLLLCWYAFSDRSTDRRLADNIEESVSTFKAPCAMSHAAESSWIYGGALAGLVLALPVSILGGFPLSGEFLAVAVLPGVICLLGLHDWVLRGVLPRQCVAISTCAALVSLSFTGGIGYPGVAGSLWLLMAIALCDPHQSAVITVKQLDRRRLVPSVVLVVGLAVTCYWTAYRPVLSNADEWNVSHWSSLAHAKFDEWLESESPGAFATFEEHADQMVSRDAHSPNVMRQLGMWYLLAGLKSEGEDHFAKSTEYLLQAVQWYPSSNALHADLAWSQYLAGRTEESAVTAAEALRLDQLVPHTELKLQARRLFDEPPNGIRPDLQITPSNRTAEQCMLLLSKE